MSEKINKCTSEQSTACIPKLASNSGQQRKHLTSINTKLYTAVIKGQTANLIIYRRAPAVTMSRSRRQSPQLICTSNAPSRPTDVVLQQIE